MTRSARAVEERAPMRTATRTRRVARWIGSGGGSAIPRGSSIPPPRSSSLAGARPRRRRRATSPVLAPGSAAAHPLAGARPGDTAGIEERDGWGKHEPQVQRDKAVGSMRERRNGWREQESHMWDGIEGDWSAIIVIARRAACCGLRP